MAVRCSLLGHAFGESEVDRTREERGSEVVVTVEEYEVCSRCGKRNVLSENTEVKRIADAGERIGDAGEADERDRDPRSTSANSARSERSQSSSGETNAPDSDGSNSNESSLERQSEGGASSDPTRSGATQPGADETAPVPTDEDGEPITDDAEILDDGEGDAPDASTRSHGEWPDSDDVGAEPAESSREPAEWPDAGDDGNEPATTGTEPTDWPDADEPTTETDVSDASPSTGDASSETNERTDTRSADTADAETSNPSETDATPTPASGIESAGEAPEPGSSPARDGVPTVYFCPRCSFVAPSDRASLRAGDICPECKKGYLGERERR